LTAQRNRTQRLRITFAKGEEIKYISHLDLMRLWVRALRRADIPMLYTQGFNPRPKISIAFPLAVGITGEREVMDVVLAPSMAPKDFASSVSSQLPAGATLLEVEEVYASLPPLQTQVRATDYVATLEKGHTGEELEQRIDRLLSSEQLPRQRRGKVYDLRPLIEGLWQVADGENQPSVVMRLLAGEGSTGRPDEVLDELGLADQVVTITRRRLYFGAT
jgi:radical SAM-linked protein